VAQILYVAIQWSGTRALRAVGIWARCGGASESGRVSVVEREEEKGHLTALPIWKERLVE
jgi:hypothetical protein